MGISRTRGADSLTYLLLPFTSKYSQKHLDTSATWNNLTKAFCLDTDDGKGRLEIDKAMENLNANRDRNDVLYIEGHCCSGGDKLLSEDQRVSIGPKELASLLATQLKPNWPGVFKIYGCHSGEGSSFLFWNYQSFVQRFADEMYNEHSFMLCHFYGYTAPNSYGAYTPSGQPALGKHKWADAAKGERASSKLVKITPIAK